MRIWIAVLSSLLMLTQGVAAKEVEKAAKASAADAASSSESSAEAKSGKEQAAKHGRLLTDDEVDAKIAARLAEIRKAKAEKLAEERMLEARVKATSDAANNKVRVKRAPPSSEWSYEGETGPEQWGKLNLAWAKCASGERQSPIDIRDGIKVDQEPVMFDYQPSHFTIVNNGYTVQVNVSGGNSITLTGRKYELMQFHFHHPSEEKVNGRNFEMVAHLVHKNPEDKLLVIAVLIESGMQHGLIQTLWGNLPLEKNEPMVPVSTIDLKQILPPHREYYTYMGSLTTPPCSEGVQWIVMKEPIQASPQQIEIFSRLYPMNARPVQAASGRLIKESN
jgi:carbonic anhydrase